MARCRHPRVIADALLSRVHCGLIVLPHEIGRKCVVCDLPIYKSTDDCVCGKDDGCGIGKIVVLGRVRQEHDDAGSSLPIDSIFQPVFLASIGGKAGGIPISSRG